MDTTIKVLRYQTDRNRSTVEVSSLESKTTSKNHEARHFFTRIIMAMMLATTLASPLAAYEEGIDSKESLSKEASRNMDGLNIVFTSVNDSYLSHLDNYGLWNIEEIVKMVGFRDKSQTLWFSAIGEDKDNGHTDTVLCVCGKWYAEATFSYKKYQLTFYCSVRSNGTVIPDERSDHSG